MTLKYSHANSMLPLYKVAPTALSRGMPSFGISFILLPDWHANGYGVDIETELLQHLVWSDNVWLLGKDFNEVRIMFAQLTAKMSDFGVQWKESSLKLMRGGGVDVEPWPAELIKVHERDFKIPWEFTSVVFGSKLNDTGDSDITVEDQLRKAMAAVWKEHVFSSASGSL